MVSDTKNKRGRPRTPAGMMGRVMKDTIFVDDGLRAATNKYYAMECLRTYYGDLDKAENGTFFVNENRKVRRQGIAEQIGRMLEAELITPDQARELIEQCIKDYENGETVKEITKHLTYFRQVLSAQDATPPT